MNLAFDWLLLADRAGMWLATYFVHSTVLLVAALLLSRWMGARRLAWQESLLKVALVGGLLTASLQVGFGWQAATGSLPYPSRSAELRSARSVVEGEAAAGVSSDHVGGLRSDATRTSGAERTDVRGQGIERAASRLGASPSLAEMPWSAVAVGLWSILAFLLSARLVVAALRLGRTLRDRVEINDGCLFQLFWRLLAAADVDTPTRLTRTTRLQVPVALGVRGREICLPSRVADSLPQEQQETVVAHELAHLERRDPIWLAGGLLLESVLFVQPLNRLVRMRLQEIAEFRCDDFAAQLTGRPLTLARCLTEVATWGSGRLALLAPTMAGRPSGLGRRVRRLLEPGYTGVDTRTPGWWLPVAAAALTLVLVAVPGFSVVGQESEPQERAEPIQEEATEAVESTPPVVAEIGESVPEAPQPTSEPTPAAAPEVPSEVSVKVVSRVRVVVEPVIAVKAPLAVEPSVGEIAPEAPRADSVPLVQTALRVVVEPAPRIQSRVAMVSPLPLQDAAPQSTAPQDEQEAERDDERPRDRRHDDDWDDDWDDEDWEAELDEFEDELDEIMEEMEEVFEEEIEVAMEALEDEMDELEDEMDEIFESEFETFEEELEMQFELFEEDLERLEDSVEERLDRSDSERLEERFENDLESVEDSVDRLEDRVDEKLDRIEERFESRMESRFDREIDHDLERQLERMEHRMESESHRLEKLAHDLAMRAHERGEQGLNAEERQQLLDEAHRLAAVAGPTPEELESIHAELERLRVEIRPDGQELEAARAEMRQELEQLAAELAAGLEEERRSLDELRRKYEG